MNRINLISAPAEQRPVFDRRNFNEIGRLGIQAIRNIQNGVASMVTEIFGRTFHDFMDMHPRARLLAALGAAGIIAGGGAGGGYGIWKYITRDKKETVQTAADTPDGEKPSCDLSKLDVKAEITEGAWDDVRADRRLVVQLKPYPDACGALTGAYDIAKLTNDMFTVSGFGDEFQITPRPDTPAGTYRIHMRLFEKNRKENSTRFASFEFRVAGRNEGKPSKKKEQAENKEPAIYTYRCHITRTSDFGVTPNCSGAPPGAKIFFAGKEHCAFSTDPNDHHPIRCSHSNGLRIEYTDGTGRQKTLRSKERKVAWFRFPGKISETWNMGNFEFRE